MRFGGDNDVLSSSELVAKIGKLGTHVDGFCVFILFSSWFSDLIATGGSAAAAGQLVGKSGGKTIEYVFIISLPFLKGEEKLDAPSYSLVQAED